MTRAEAREIMKCKAPTRYHGTALGLLSNLVDASFGPETVRTVTFKDTTLMRRVGIGDRQLKRTLDRFNADSLGVFNCKGGKVIVRLDLSPLASLPEKPTQKEVRADRARKAREARAALRQAQQEARETESLILQATRECWAAIRASGEMHTLHP
jgi:hypothetical protein